MSAGYTDAVIRRRPLTAILMMLVAGGTVVAAAQGPTLLAPDGTATDWGAWLDSHGRSAVVVWASWAPQAATALAALEGLSAACRDAGLSLVVVAVQEPVEASRTALSDRHVAWLHDRHGAFLKRYRLIRLPTLVIVDRDGKMLSELPVSVESLRKWAAK